MADEVLEQLGGVATETPPATDGLGSQAAPPSEETPAPAAEKPPESETPSEAAAPSETETPVSTEEKPELPSWAAFKTTEEVLTHEDFAVGLKEREDTGYERGRAENRRLQGYLHTQQNTLKSIDEKASVFAAGYPTDAGAAMVIEFDGTEVGLDADADRAVACCMAAGAREVRRATTEAQREALWKGRKKAFGAMGRIAPDLLVQDATVPRTRLPEVLRGVAEIGERYDLKIANVFHAGDGNLHPNILFDRQNEDEVARVERASREIMALCVEVGGTITGEHGVGIDKRAYMSLVHNEVEIDSLRSVRRVFDPEGLFNPGKVLPDPVEVEA